MSTISDVAKLAGVSPMTVSRAINKSGYISQEARERVEKAIVELGYVPNALARYLRFKQTSTIALILPDITNNLLRPLHAGRWLRHGAAGAGCRAAPDRHVRRE